MVQAGDDLSARQRRILEFLDGFMAEKDYPPSIRDIQQGCEISSTSVVDYNLKRLEERGYIRRDREVSRGIELLDGSGRRRRAPLTVPVLGKIAAGSPIPTFPETLGTDVEQIEVTRDQTRGRAQAFALRVEGTSMIDDLINDGDIVILEPTNTCDDGERVAVWLKDEVRPRSSVSTARASASASSRRTPRWTRSTPRRTTSRCRAACSPPSASRGSAGRTPTRGRCPL